MKSTHTGHIVFTESVSKGIILIKIKLTEPDFVDFRAGQYLAVLLPDAEKVAYYSIASSPNKKNTVELLVKEDKLGVGASYLFSLSEGDPIDLHMPMGDAYLREDSERNIIFVAGASGASYIRSMIHYLDESNLLLNRQVYYFLGTREEDELMEPEYMHQLAEKYSGFHFIPALSHQQDWEGHTGLVTEVIERVMPSDLSDWEAYSAGSPAMVKAVANTLISDKRLRSDCFYSDLYVADS
ncbi:MAG: FAD-binding oxidoreductase [Cycloclasticus sp.]|nr:FAD-binding oxidoreductase [Cycloclasticus sp.]